VVNFLLLFPKLTYYSKKEIDQGNTPSEIYDICSSIKETFCLSYSIRKENNLFLYFIDNNISIKLIGRKLRYMGSDERSQALLLNKAIKKLDKYSLSELNQWKESTPGIYIKSFSDVEQFLRKDVKYDITSFFYIIHGSELENEALASIPYNNELSLVSPQKSENYLFILPNFNFSYRYPEKFKLIKKLKNTTFVKLTKSNIISDKILLINFEIDKTELSS
jgi:hypothetical protein